MFKELLKLSQIKEIRILGLMTGTSADGLDIAGVKFKGFDKYPDYEVYYSNFIPYPRELSEPFKRPLELSASEIADLNMKLGKWYGGVISELNIDFDLIANHGQTLLHNAPNYTVQIGEALFIAEECRKPVIYDFRTRDLVLGGQGAPLIPVVDEFLLRESDTCVIALNMGGIANLTYLPPKGSSEKTVAWDTGPANTLIDKAVFDYSKGDLDFDRDGNFARSGKLNIQLLNSLMGHPYITRPFPKSAGQEQFGYDLYNEIKNKISPSNDQEWFSFINTLTEFTIRSIEKDIRELIKNEKHPIKIITSGGGSENVYIMDRLREAFQNCIVTKFNKSDLDSDIKEAFGFAYLGYLFMRGLPGNMPSVTGSSRKTILGKIVW